MSHVMNDLYLENVKERFDELKDGHSRCALLTEMRWQGFDSHADSLIEDWYMERLDWLEERGVSESDVHLEIKDSNHYNMEFYFDVEEMGTTGDDYQVDTVKRYLPSHLNVAYWLDISSK